MSDITKCDNNKCPLRAECWRAIAKSNPYWQAYAMFEYEERDGKVVCDSQWYYSKEEESNEEGSV